MRRGERGATLIEYVLLVTFLAIVCIGITGALGGAISAKYQLAADQLCDGSCDESTTTVPSPTTTPTTQPPVTTVPPTTPTTQPTPTTVCVPKGNGHGNNCH